MQSKIISFSSGKGGVGKTSLVANMGCLWAGHGKNVLLIDADWTLGKLSIPLGVKPRYTWDGILRGEMTLKESIEKVSPNLSLLASPSGLLGLEEISETVRNQLFFEMESIGADYDLILIDHSSGSGWGVLQFAASAHQHVIVTTAEPTAYTDAYAIMKLLSKRFGVKEFWLLVTMSQKHSETEQIINKFSDVARHHLGIRLHSLGIFAWEPRLAESIRRRKPFVYMYPHAPMTQHFQKVCVQLQESESVASHGLSLLYREQNHTLPVR